MRSRLGQLNRAEASVLPSPQSAAREHAAPWERRPPTLRELLARRALAQDETPTKTDLSACGCAACGPCQVPKAQADLASWASVVRDATSGTLDAARLETLPQRLRHLDPGIALSALLGVTLSVPSPPVLSAERAPSPKALATEPLEPKGITSNQPPSALPSKGT